MPDLQLPHNPQLFTEPIVGQRLQIHDVCQAGRPFIGWAAWQPLPADLADGPRRATDGDDLTRLGDGGHARPRG